MLHPKSSRSEMGISDRIYNLHYSRAAISPDIHTHTFSPLRHQPYVIFSLLEMFGGQVKSVQSVADIYIIRHFYHTKYHQRQQHVLCSLIRVLSKPFWNSQKNQNVIKSICSSYTIIKKISLAPKALV